MTQPAQPPGGLPPLLDPGNALLSKMTSSMIAGKLPTPDGETGVVTIRQGNTTLTLIMDKSEVIQWAESLACLRDSMSGSQLVIPARGDAARIASTARAPVNGQG